MEPVEANDDIKTNVWQSPEKSKWKEVCSVSLVNSTTHRLSNQAKRPDRISWSSELVEMVYDSSFVKSGR